MFTDVSIFICVNCLENISKKNKSFWSKTAMAVNDTILKQHDDFKTCRNPQKVDMTIGSVRKEGKPFILQCVKKAEKIIYTMNLHKHYLPPLGNMEFRKLVAELIFGSNCQQVNKGLIATVQALARTGAMLLGTCFINHFYSGHKVVYLPAETWANHKRLLMQGGLAVEDYKYYNHKTNTIDTPGMLQSIKSMPEKSIILLHVCGHNPTGIDPTPIQWEEISNIVKSRNLLVFFDMNNQGFASGNLDEDAQPVRQFLKRGHNMIIAQSFSKNMGLYGERQGSLSIVANTSQEVEKICSQLKIIIRGLYSNPPLHGSRIVSKILEDHGLRNEWHKEVKAMVTQIQTMRKLLVQKLYKEGSTRNWDHVIRQKGSFGFLGLNQTQLIKLRNEHHVYVTKNGRISFGGVHRKNVGYIAHALHRITK